MAYTIAFKEKGKDLTMFVHDVAQSIRNQVANSRFTLEMTVGPKKISMSKIRLRKSKDYCGNHPLACPVRPGGHAPHKHMTFLEGSDWVAFNDKINDILDELKVNANVGSSHVVTRKGLERCVEYTAYTLGNGIDNEWTKDSGAFANCIGRKVQAEYPEGTPGIYSWT